MTKEARADLLRALHRAKMGRMAYVPSGRPKKGALVRPVVDRLVIGWPLFKPDTNRAPLWAKQPDHSPPLHLAPKRTERPSPLTKIAQKWGTSEWFQNRYRLARLPNKPRITKLNQNQKCE